ncbi:30S ribosomal protein S16 [Candidatus Parcubacteria bacterium]|nr:MAG: 30S ribosomal protein S16 [Candidatus Parcubacteria bacterium]
MLAIRFQRVGRTKLPMYRVVVSEKTKDMHGDHLEILGTYNPHNKEVKLKTDRIKYWLGKGAQSSESIHNLFIKEGVLEGAKRKSVSISDRRKAKMESVKAKAEEAKKAAQAKVEAEAKSAAETPVEDAPSVDAGKVAE